MIRKQIHTTYPNGPSTQGWGSDTWFRLHRDVRWKNDGARLRYCNAIEGLTKTGPSKLMDPVWQYP